MKPRVTVITLAVEDLNRSLAFYRDGLGLETDGIVGTDIEHGAVAFFQLEDGGMLALWPAASLRADTGIEPSQAAAGAQSDRMTLGHNVGSRERVDEVMTEAEAAGARIVTPAADRAWGGYTGYFADPDGHLWEVVWNPSLPVDDQA